MSCKERIPDHTDFINCGQYSGAGDYCWEHLVARERKLQEKLEDQKAKVQKIRSELAAIQKEMATWKVKRKG